MKPLTIQYADYAIWQRQYLSGDVLNNKLNFWKDNLQGVETLQLPTDFARPAVQSLRGAMISGRIDSALSHQLQVLSQAKGGTLFMTLLAGFNVLLHRYSGQQDICVGSPIAGRQQQELEHLIGFFVNTLALRNTVNEEEPFIDLFQQVKNSTLKAFEHQEVPFEKVVEAVVRNRDLSRSPLFQVLFVLRNTPEVPEIDLGEIKVSNASYQHTTAMFDLIFYLTETSEGLHIAVEYSTDLFSAQTIQRMIGHYGQLLQEIVKDPQQKIGALQMVTEEENNLLQSFNNTAVDFAKGATIAGLFQQQAQKTPGALAIRFEGKQLTYSELNEQANQWAHYLQSKGVQADSLVPVCIERRIEMIVAVLAILKAGGCYVPIDPDYPQERIRYMVEETKAPLILSSQNSKQFLPEDIDAEIIEIDNNNAIAEQPITNPQPASGPDNLAYVLYTSGSTGRPKGVKMPQKALTNLLQWQQQQFGHEHRTVLQFASLNFDVSFQEIFSTLCFGSTLCLIDADRRKDAAELVIDIKRYGITHLFLPYIVLKTIAEQLHSSIEQAASLQQVIVAGEQLKLTGDITAFLKQSGVTLINQYGPTEAHVVSSYTVDTSKELLALCHPSANPLPIPGCT